MQVCFETKYYNERAYTINKIRVSLFTRTACYKWHKLNVYMYTPTHIKCGPNYNTQIDLGQHITHTKGGPTWVKTKPRHGTLEPPLRDTRLQEDFCHQKLLVK